MIHRTLLDEGWTRQEKDKIKSYFKLFVSHIKSFILGRTYLPFQSLEGKRIFKGNENIKDLAKIECT